MFFGWLRSRRTSLVAALLLLNFSLTFSNIWPTPFVTWRGDVSSELMLCLLALVVASLWLGRPSRGVLRSIAAIWTVLVLGHYADVTGPALYGRSVNLYWDVRFLPAVAEMLASAASRWLVLLVLVAAIVVCGLLYTALRSALGRIGRAVEDGQERRAIGAIAIVALLLLAAQHASPLVPELPRFASPVTGTYARQVRLVLNARAAANGTRVMVPSPPMNSDLALVKDTDVFLLFIESYGAVTFDKPEFARALAADRSNLEAAIRETGRTAVSAFVESPTFGGSSWLAHVTLLSGVEVRDPDTNALLMTQKRDTLVTDFARHGFRTVGVMPGMWQTWPEGAFYGFDQIYGGARLDYHGPQFGWWDIPDQYAIARMDALEVNRAPRAPVFVFFPTVSTHIPFSPTPPYQPDWARILTADPFDMTAIDRAFEVQPDWLDLGPSYVAAMSYAYQSLTGYLRLRRDRDFVMILLGDHQPAAAVTGEGAPWDVPVHVIASRQAVLDRLLARGFRLGLTPARPVLGHMHNLLPVLLDAFGNREATAGAPP